MSLESAKSYGYRASIIFCIIPIISIIANIGIYAQLFKTLGAQIANNPNATIDPISPAIANSLVVLTSIIGLITGVLGLTALVLFLIAHYRLSKYYKEPAIFRNIIYSIILTIGYVIAAIIAVVGIVLITALTTFSTEFIPDIGTATSAVYAPLSIILVVFVIITILFVIFNLLLWYRAFNKLGDKSGVDAFKTAGLLYVIGTFIPFVSCIAWIYAAKGYKQLQIQQPPNNEYYTPTYTPTSPVFNGIFCSQCGTENLSNDLYCKQCGHPLQTTQTNTTT